MVEVFVHWYLYIGSINLHFCVRVNNTFFYHARVNNIFFIMQDNTIEVIIAGVDPG